MVIWLQFPVLVDNYLTATRFLQAMQNRAKEK